MDFKRVTPRINITNHLGRKNVIASRNVQCIVKNVNMGVFEKIESLQKKTYRESNYGALPLVYGIVVAYSAIPV